MNKLLAFFASLFLLGPIANAQTRTKMDFHLRSFLERSHEGTEMIDLFIHGEKEAVSAAVVAHGGFVKMTLPRLVSARVPVGRIARLADEPAVHHFEFSLDRGELMNDSMRVKNRVNEVQQGMAPLPQGYDGTGVVVGFIDTGLAFNHPDFKNADGTTRVLRYWDQGPPPNALSPQPYGYGSECTREQLNAGSCNWLVADSVSGHGTTVAGTGVGNGLANGRHKGVASGADIVVVTTNFALPNWRSTVADGVAYIIAQAAAVGKPAVINASLGSYLGSHDGKDAAGLFIQDLLTAQGGRVMVSASGNNNSQAPYHMQTQVDADTSFTWFEINPNSILGVPAVFFELWADAEDLDDVLFAVGCDQRAPNWQLRGHTQFRSVDQILGQVVSDTIYNPSGQRMAVVEYYAELRGQQIQMQVALASPDSLGRYYRFMTTGSGKFDVWSTSLYGTSFMISSLPTVEQQPDIVDYVLPDNNKHMVDSWACLTEVITVANYCNEVTYTDYAGNPQTVPGEEQNIALNSSKGPTRDERLKPDIAATGDITFSAASMNLINWIIVNQNGWKIDPGGMHVRNGGTSMASPVVAGTAALYLQKCPTATAEEIRLAMHANARSDAFTGVVPNNRWGMGKLDAFNTVLNTAALMPESTTICEGQSVEVTFPNRFSDVLWSNGSTTNPLFMAEAGSLSATLYTPSGCLTQSDTVQFTVIPSPPIPVVEAVGNVLTSSVGPSYQWFRNGEALDSEVGQSLEAPGTGTYSVQFVAANGCITESEPVVIINVGMADGSVGSFAMWPSPAQDLLQLRLPPSIRNFRISIISSEGRIVRREQVNSAEVVQIPLNGLAAGAYTLQVQGDENHWSRRFVKLP